MHSSMFLSFAFLAAAIASPQQSIGTLALGSICTATSECASGAQCYAVSSSAVTRCGNLEATCTSDSQCAFNTCVSGSCSGALVSSSPTTVAPSTTTSTSPAAATGLALGATCTPNSQCANGAQCYAVNSMEIAHCGNFQAACTSDSQCAYNTCVSGFCSGILSSTSSATGSATVSSKQSSASSPSGKASTTSGASRSNVTSTGVPTGFTTSMTVVNGATSSVLINSAGATTSFGAVATSVSNSTHGSGADKLAVRLGGMLAVAGGIAMLL